MNHFGLSVFISCSILLASAVGDTGLSGNWTGFRGPTGQGHAENVNPPLTWSETKNIVWKTAIPGEGWSSPVVYEGSVYVSKARLDEDNNPSSLRLIRLDAESGEIVWNKQALPWSGPSPKRGNNTHANPTPVAENGRIYVHFGHMGTACLDTNGTVVWQQQELLYGPRHGNGGSPVLVGDKLIYSADGSPEPFVVALSKQTGQVAWKTMRNADHASNVHSFSTPCVVEYDGQTQIISPGSGIVGAYDAKDGREIWRLNYGRGYSVVPCPAVGRGKVFVSSGYGDNTLYAIRLGGAGDVTETHVAWEIRGAPKVVSPLYLDGNLYMLAENGMLNCLDAATGELHWQEQLGGQFYASPVYAKGRLYILNQRGTMWVLKPGEKAEILAENSLDEQAFATPAFAHNAVFIRTRDHLYRIEEISEIVKNQ